MNEKHKKTLEDMALTLRQQLSSRIIRRAQSHVGCFTRQEVASNDFHIKRIQDQIDALEAALELAGCDEGIDGVMA